MLNPPHNKLGCIHVERSLKTFLQYQYQPYSTQLRQFEGADIWLVKETWCPQNTVVTSTTALGPIIDHSDLISLSPFSSVHSSSSCFIVY
jgi:hypothetical protein